MTDYTADGPAPVEDAAVPDPPTVDEVAEEQRRKYPDQVVEEQVVEDDAPAD